MKYTYQTTELPPDPQGEVAVLTGEFPAGQEWHVLSQPVQLESDTLVVSVCRKPGPLCVKLFPYVTATRPEGVMGYALQLGAHIAMNLIRPGDVELLLVIGVPAFQKHDSAGREQLQIYIGAAIRRK